MADKHAEVLVLGAGPGGYSAAFRAADLGKKVVLVERWSTLGGVCLNVGCIPSKALLHAAKVMSEAREMSAHGVKFGEPTVDLDGLRSWKQDVVSRLVTGLAGLAKQRKVEVVSGTGTFAGPHEVHVSGADGTRTTVSFDHAIIACGSEPVTLPMLPNDDPRIIDSTGALDLVDVPERLLVIGGGIIGLEMATVYNELGSAITIVELMDQLIPGADPDLVAPLHKRLKAQYESIKLKTKVVGVEATDQGLVATLESAEGTTTEVFDKVLVSVGRVPNGRLIGADQAGVHIDDRGFIPVDSSMRTNVSHILAIGDVVGQPMLAHKAVHEAHVAAEVAAGQDRVFDPRVIPSVAYTDPEVAWTGLTEQQAMSQGRAFRTGFFPWAANGRSLSLGRSEGLTKVVVDSETREVLGVGIVGTNAGELISEVSLAIELGAEIGDLAHTIHPHPTLSETVGLSAEVWEGTVTDLYLPKKAK